MLNNWVIIRQLVDNLGDLQSKVTAAAMSEQALCAPAKWEATTVILISIVPMECSLVIKVARPVQQTWTGGNRG